MLNNIGLPGLLLIAVVVLVLFGRGKISSLMGEVGKGITAFKRGVSDGEAEERKSDNAREISAPETESEASAPGRATAHQGTDGTLDPERRG